MGAYICRKCDRTYHAKRRKTNGLCAVCGYQQLQEEIDQLQARAGPMYDKWKLGMEVWKRERKKSARPLHSQG